MRSLLVLLASAVALSALPGAAATNNVCDPGNLACAYEGSSSWGTCEDGIESNFAGASLWDGTTRTEANAGTQCWTWHSYSGNNLFVSASRGGPMGLSYAQYQWQATGSGEHAQCSSTLAVAGGPVHQYHALGCPAGAPPQVGALLP